MLVIPSLHGGGAERVAVSLAEHWSYQGYDVILVTHTDKSSDVYELNKLVTRVSTGLFSQTGIFSHLKKVLAIRKAMCQYRPDVVVGVMMSSSVLSILAGMGLPTKVIATEHAHPPSQKMSSFWYKLRQWTYPKAAQVLALTEKSADWLRNHIPNSKISVIQNAVNWPLTNTEPILPIQKPLQGKRLLAVGRLHQEKGFDILLNAYAKIAEKYPHWQLIILGEGAERTSLTKQIEHLSLRDKVLLPGRVGNLKDWYESADLFVLSSHNEGLSNSLQEAMASGLCAVSFDCDTGPREIIRDGIDGILVRPVADAEAMARQLDDLMGNESLRLSYASQATSVRERFSMQKISQDWEKLFSELGIKK